MLGTVVAQYLYINNPVRDLFVFVSDNYPFH